MREICEIIKWFEKRRGGMHEWSMQAKEIRFHSFSISSTGKKAFAISFLFYYSSTSSQAFATYW